MAAAAADTLFWIKAQFWTTLASIAGLICALIFSAKATFAAERAVEVSEQSMHKLEGPRLPPSHIMPWTSHAARLPWRECVEAESRNHGKRSKKQSVELQSLMLSSYAVTCLTNKSEHTHKA